MNDRETDDLPLAQPLTAREQDILTLIGEGMSNRQISEQLIIAMSTVKWYVRQIYNKLGVSNRGEAVARALGLGLLLSGEKERAARHNLPAAVTPFIGREQELKELATLLAEPQVGIITIVGPGGIGKTRLALEAAEHALAVDKKVDDRQKKPTFPEGIFFVPLAPLNSADEIVATLATTFDFHFQGLDPSTRSEFEQIVDYLEQKEMLLIVDNFEHVLDGRMLLAEIRERASRIKLLVTSRERLQLHGEQLYPLQGLEMPQKGASTEETVGSTSAAQLFLSIARRTVPDFQLLERDVEQLHHICRLVEGMPLGLELAASWVGLLPLSDIANEIEESLQLLATEDHDVPERHKSMQATLDTSWRRLSQEQRRAFQELTVFRGGFTRTAALQVAAATLPLLVTLVNKSWLSYARESDRYKIHELLRQYGADKLSENSGSEQEVQERHSAFFWNLLREREADWHGSRQKDAAAEIQDEIDNIQAAWVSAANQGKTKLLAQGLNSLCRFYQREGRMKDGQNACRITGEGLSKWLADQQANDLEAMALWSLALAWESEFVYATEQKEKLVAQSQDLLDRVTASGRDSRSEQAFIFVQKASAAGFRDFDEALCFSNLALILIRELKDQRGEAEALHFQGRIRNFRGEYEQAKELLANSLDISQQLDDALSVAQSTMYLGIVARHQGHFEKAESLHRKSLALFQQLGNQLRERECLVILAFTLIWAGKFSAAREYYERAIELDRDLGRYPNPWSHNAITKATIHLGRYSEAKQLANEVLGITRQRGLPMPHAFELFFLGNIAFVEGDLSRARRYLLESAGFLTDLHIYHAIPLAILSYVLRAKGDIELARNYLSDALRSGIECRSISPIIYCLPAAALLAADKGHSERAVELYGLAQQFGHITNSRWFEAIACRELEGVMASMPLEAASDAVARGRGMDLWATAEEVLRELDS